MVVCIGESTHWIAIVRFKVNEYDRGKNLDFFFFAQCALPTTWEDARVNGVFA